MAEEKKEVFADPEQDNDRMERLSCLADGLVGPDGVVAACEVNLSKEDARALGIKCDNRCMMVKADEILSRVGKAEETKRRRVQPKSKKE